MSEVDRQKDSFDCENAVNQTNRPKRSRLEDLLVTLALGANELNLEKLPSNCLQNILSFMSYEKVSQTRQVCKVFNEIGKQHLDIGQRRLEKRLRRETKMAEKRVLFPTNLISSYDTLQFLTGLHKAISNRNVTDRFFKNKFVAAKLLDEANYLLENFHSSTVVPYFKQYVNDEMSHPLLGPIVAQCVNAHHYYITRIVRESRDYFGAPATERYLQSCHKMGAQTQQNKLKAKRMSFLKAQRRKIDCGNELRGEFLKLILNFNENVLDLTQFVKKLDNEMEQVISKSNQGVSDSFWETKVMKITGSKRPNLATLPAACLQNIVSRLLCHKIAQLRIICASFNLVCRKELDREFAEFKHMVEFQRKFLEKITIPAASTTELVRISLFKYLSSILRLFEDNLGTNYYFAAGKVLDEAKVIYMYSVVPPAYYNLCFSIHDIDDLVYKAIAHFNFNIIPKFFPSAFHHFYVPDYIISGDVKERQLNLEEVEKLSKETNAKIQEQNDRNRELFKIFYGLKKKVITLNEELSERIDVLKEMEEVKNQ